MSFVSERKNQKWQICFNGNSRLVKKRKQVRVFQKPLMFQYIETAFKDDIGRNKIA